VDVFIYIYIYKHITDIDVNTDMTADRGTRASETGDVTYERVVSHMEQSCYIPDSYVTYQTVMLHIKQSCHI